MMQKKDLDLKEKCIAQNNNSQIFILKLQN